jgi:hypothetical protein
MIDIFTNFVTNAAAVAVVGYLLQLWVSSRLEHSLSQELEKFKAELTKEVTRHSVQTTWNHAKRMELFTKLYEQMIDVDFELKALLMNLKVGNADLVRDRAVKFSEKYLELNACLHKNELFLEESVVQSVRAAYEPYFDLARMVMVEHAELAKFRSHLPDGMEEIFAVGDGPRKQTVALFRKYAGLSE